MKKVQLFGFMILFPGLFLIPVPTLQGQTAARTVELEKGRLVSADRVIVKWKKQPGVPTAGSPQPKSATVAPRLSGVKTQRSFSKLPGLAVLELSPAAQPQIRGAALSPVQHLRQKMEELMASGQFEYVVPDDVLTISVLPSDSAFTDGTLWGLRNTGQNGGTNGADIGVVTAWDKTIGSTNVIVAVIDTGIRYTHQDLAANMWRNPGESGGGRETNGMDDDENGYVDDVFGINAILRTGDPMDDNNHGTHCAGTIGAVANGGGPHVGVAWNVRLMALKFLSAGGSGFTSDAILCIDYAVAQGARILSNSWGGGGFSQALYEAIQKAEAAGVLFVAAAGNSARNTDQSPAYPASYDLQNIVSVAAINRFDALASFSNYGKQSVDVGAPGVAIYSCTASSDSSYASYQGTSMATPHVAGVAALILSSFPAIELTELKARILGTAISTPALQNKCVSGGRVHAGNALTASPDGDGVMEASVRFATVPLAGGETADIFVFLSDLLPVRGATVSGFFGTANPQLFSDNGISPDATANDGVYSASILVPSGSSTATLTVRAVASGKVDLVQTNSVEVVARPANDDFAQQITLSSTQRFTTGSNLYATSQGGEPLTYFGSGGRTVWWRWTTATNVPATFSTRGSDFDTILSVYEGDRLDNLQMLGFSLGQYSPVTIQAEAGLVYRIQVDGFGGDAGRIVLNHPASSPPTTAPVILEEPDDGGVLVNGPLELSVFADGAESYQWFLDDGAVAGATNAIYLVDQAGEADQGYYRVRISNQHGSTNSRQAYVLVEKVGLRPPNDDFTGARVLSGNSGRLSLSTASATGEPGEPNHAGVSTNPAGKMTSVWFLWSNAVSGEVTCNTFGSGFDTTLAAYTGGSIGGLTLIQANDDTNGVAQSRIRFQYQTGTTVKIAVAGKNGAAGPLVFDYDLFAPDSGPRNDTFNNRTVLEGTNGLITGRNTGATGEAGERIHVSKANPLASVWYAWTAPSNGMAIFSTTQNSFDTVLAAYRTSTLPTAASRPVAENDDYFGEASQISFYTFAGEAFFIVVDGYGAEEGDFKLRWSFGTYQDSYPFPRIVSTVNLNAVFGRSFSHQVRTENPVVRHSLTGTLPVGLTFNATNGVLSGIPLEKGSYKLFFSVEDSEQRQDSQAATLTVRDPQPRVTSPASATAVVGTAFSYQIAALGEPTRFDADGLPPGLTINTSTGLITGTPARAGLYLPVLTARNDRGTARLTLRLTVTGVLPRLTSDLGPVEINLRQRYSHQVTCTRYVFEYLAQGLPPGLRIDRRTGLISGTAKKVGRYEAVVQAVATGGTAEGRKVFLVK